MTVPRAVFRYIEHELYNYKETKKEIQELREDIQEGMSVPLKEAVPGRGYISDPTSRKAMKLLTSKALKKMVGNVTAIDRALNRLNDDHRQLFVLKYQHALHWKKVCSEMPVSDRTYFRLRRELVLMVAAEMGLLAEVGKGE